MQRKELWIASAFSLAFGFVLLLPYLGGHWRLADDASYLTLPTAILQSRILAEGMWPLWNPNAGVGAPWGIAPIAGIYNPLQIAWGLAIGWSETKYLLYVLLHLALGGVFAAAFARRARLSLAAALFFACATVGSGLVVGMFSNPYLFAPYLFWPLLGTGLLRLHQERDAAPAILIIAIAVAMIELTGYPLSRLIIYAATAATYLLMTREPGTWWRGPRWRPLLYAGCAAFLIALPQTVVTLGDLRDSERGAGGIYDDSVYHNVANPMLAGSMLLPAQFMARNQFQLGSMHLERSWWVGWLTLALVLAAAYTGRLRAGRLLVAGAVSFAGILYAVGGHSFVRELASSGMPLLESLRHSHLGRMAFNSLVAFAGALALDTLAAAPRPPAAAAAAGGRRLAWLWGGYLVACAVAALSEADHPQLAKNLYFDVQSGWKVSLLHLSFYLLLAYSAWARRADLPRWLPWAWVVVALQFISMGDVGYAFRYQIAERRDAPFKTVEPEFRAARPQPNERVSKAWFDTDAWYSWEGNQKVLNAYNPPAHRLESAAKADPRIAPLLTRLASCQDRAAEVVGELSAAPFSCAGHEFRIDYHFGNRIELSGAGPSPALMLVHDLYDPRWRARLNGAEVPVYRGYGLLKTVVVPGGGQPWKLELEFRHPAMPWVWAAPLVGIAMLGFVSRRRRPERAAR